MELCHCLAAKELAPASPFFPNATRLLQLDGGGGGRLSSRMLYVHLLGNRCIYKKTTKKLFNTHDNIENTNRNRSFIALPYVKELENFINYFFKKQNTNVIYSTKNKLNKIMKLGKDKTKICDNVNVVYKINCKNCDASYVGQTCRRLDVRIKEHTRKYNMQDDNFSLYTHKIDNNHNIDFSNIKILDTEYNRGIRLFSEAFFIHTQKNYMNKQFEISKLASDYTSLINNVDFMRSKY